MKVKSVKVTCNANYFLVSLLEADMKVKLHACSNSELVYYGDLAFNKRNFRKLVPKIKKRFH